MAGGISPFFRSSGQERLPLQPVEAPGSYGGKGSSREGFCQEKPSPGRGRDYL